MGGVKMPWDQKRVGDAAEQARAADVAKGPVNPLPTVPSFADQAVQAAAQGEVLRSRMKAQKTLLTTALGDLSPAPITKGSLLGE
jgi:hypothetical protein